MTRPRKSHTTEGPFEPPRSVRNLNGAAGGDPCRFGSFGESGPPARSATRTVAASGSRARPGSCGWWTCPSSRIASRHAIAADGSGIWSRERGRRSPGPPARPRHRTCSLPCSSSAVAGKNPVVARQARPTRGRGCSSSREGVKTARCASRCSRLVGPSAQEGRRGRAPLVQGPALAAGLHGRWTLRAQPPPNGCSEST